MFAQLLLPATGRAVETNELGWMQAAAKTTMASRMVHGGSAGRSPESRWKKTLTRKRVTPGMA